MFETLPKHCTHLRRRGFALAFAAALFAAAVPALAQTDLQVRGAVDLVGAGHDADAYLNFTMLETTNFDLLRARIFVEGGTERTRAFVQTLLTDAGRETFLLYGAYVQHRLFEDREWYVEAGKIPVHLGIWAPKAYAQRNPLVGVPLAYYYRSTLPFRMMPNDLDDLLAHRGQGQQGVVYTNPDGSLRGGTWGMMPLLYDNCWDYGAFVLGANHRFDAAFGVTLGPPGAPAMGPETNGSVAWNAKIGWAPVPALSLHVSFARGAYLTREVAPWVPAGKRVEDYAQTLWVASAEWNHKHSSLTAETFFSHAETPLRADGLSSFSYYIEGRQRFGAGWYAAARWDEIRFEEVDGTAGRMTWDQNVRRIEAGFGYRVNRELLVKAVAQVNDTGNGLDFDRTLPAVQAAFAF